MSEKRITITMWSKQRINDLEIDYNEIGNISDGKK